MATAEKIIQLRQLLAERFPAAHVARPPGNDAFATQLERLDKLGLPKGEITEVISAHASAGVATLLAALIESARRAPHHVALVDGRDGFDPGSISAAAGRNLLWVRCRSALEATQAADLIMRDGNLPFVIIDLRANPVKEVQRLGSPIWYRLQTLGRHSSITCLVLTPTQVVSSARLRLTVGRRAALAELDCRREQWLAGLPLRVTRRRVAGGEGVTANADSNRRQAAG